MAELIVEQIDAAAMAKRFAKSRELSDEDLENFVYVYSCNENVSVTFATQETPQAPQDSLSAYGGKADPGDAGIDITFEEPTSEQAASLPRSYEGAGSRLFRATA